jgi:hypothetical protein
MLTNIAAQWFTLPLHIREVLSLNLVVVVVVVVVHVNGVKPLL